MVDENSLGPMGPNIISVESISDTVYSVEGHNFVTGFRIEIKDGVGQSIDGVTVSETKSSAFLLTLPYSTPGAYTLVVINPDGRTSTQSFATPGTDVSNDKLRADS